MKEAAGEANMTVITIVLIAIVLAVGTLIVRGMLGSTQKSSCCTANGGIWKGGTCYAYCEDNNNAGTCSGSVPTICSDVDSPV